jgi:hypothetical protein
MVCAGSACAHHNICSKVRNRKTTGWHNALADQILHRPRSKYKTRFLYSDYFSVRANS